MNKAPHVPVTVKGRSAPIIVVTASAANTKTEQAVVLSTIHETRAPKNYLGRPVNVVTYMVSHSDGRLWHVTTKQEALRIFNKLRGEVLS